MKSQGKRYDRALTIWGFVWALPVTLLGLVALLLTLPRLRVKGGVLLGTSDRGFTHLFLARRGFVAITLGRVVLAVRPLRTETWNHELEHARQAERWGFLYLPLYLFHHFRSGYHHNPFEQEAVATGRSFREDHPELADELLS